MRSLRLALVLVPLTLLIACGDEPASPPTAPSPPTGEAPPPTTAPPGGQGGQSAAVTIPAGAEFLGDRAYNPPELDVAVGTRVTWTNTDSTSHTSTSDTPGWDSGIVARNGTFSFAFQTPGTFRYHCAIHPSMTGSVVVR